jgi:hypothetical protein
MPVGCPGCGHRANSQSRSAPETGSRHHTSVRSPRPTLIGRASNRAPMSARAVAVIRPAPTIIARLAFLCILSGRGQLHACKDRRAAELILARSTRLHQKPNTSPQTCLLSRTEPCSHAADHTFSVLTSASDPAPHSAASLETGLSDLRLQVNARSKADFGGASPQRLDFLGLENDIKRSETHHLDFTVFEAWAITTTSLIVQSGVAPARPATRAPNAFAKLAACDMGHPRS